MLTTAGNLTNGSHPLLFKCLEFLTSLTSDNSSQSQVTFKTNSGTQFVKVDGFRHYPILVSEALFKFLTALGTAGLIITFVVCTTLWLCYCDHLLRLFVEHRRKRQLQRARQAHCERRHVVVFSRPTPPQSTPPEEPTFVKRYLREPAVTIDGKFVVQAFEKTGNNNKIGIHLQVSPKIRCTRLNCDRLGCPRQHTFYISIGCNHTFHPQLEISYPPRQFSSEQPEVDEVDSV